MIISKKCLIAFLLCSLGMLYVWLPSGHCSGQEFSLMPWRVGQFVEYRIIGYDGRGQDNLYRLKITGQDMLEADVHYWIKFEIIHQNKPEVIVTALVRPITSRKFAENPPKYFREWLFSLLKEAKKLSFRFYEDNVFEIDPNDLNRRQPEILNGSIYEKSDFTDGKIDFSRLFLLPEQEQIRFGQDYLSCYHFHASTHAWDPLNIEGLDVWRTPEVPFLGIVRMEFSRTKAWQKWRYKFQQLMANSYWYEKLYAFIFLRRPLRNRDLEDTFTMQLIACGKGD